MLKVKQPFNAMYSGVKTGWHMILDRSFDTFCCAKYSGRTIRMNGHFVLRSLYLGIFVLLTMTLDVHSMWDCCTRRVAPQRRLAVVPEISADDSDSDSDSEVAHTKVCFKRPKSAAPSALATRRSASRQQWCICPSATATGQAVVVVGICMGAFEGVLRTYAQKSFYYDKNEGLQPSAVVCTVLTAAMCAREIQIGLDVQAEILRRYQEKKHR